MPLDSLQPCCRDHETTEVAVWPGHTLLRGVDNPNKIFVRVEFDSAEEARSFAEKVRASDVLQNVTVELPPTVTETADTATY
jgi:hypothetical protein